MKAIIAKRSGESLNKGATGGEPWTRRGRMETAAELQAISEYIARPDNHELAGMVLVVGAGNLAMRGEILQTYGVNPKMADQMGMVGTVWNAQVIAEDLTDAKVPHRLMIARGVGYDMPNLRKIEVATPEAVNGAFERKELVVIGGGSGKTGQTTDAAAIDHAVDLRWTMGTDVQVLKGTKYAGVFDADPALYDDARLFGRVSAATMRDEDWAAVDARCLELIEEYGIEMRVHAADMPLLEAIAGKVGTLIVPQPGVLEYSPAAAGSYQ